MRLELRQRLAALGAAPDLLRIVVAVSRALPPGISEEDLFGFFSRYHVGLAADLAAGFSQLPPPGHPADLYPPRVGPVRRSMSLAEVEAAIMREPAEHTVLFDARGQQVGRFGPDGTAAAGYDPRSKTLLDGRVSHAARRDGNLTLTHNHPTCGCISDADLLLAVRLNLREVRAVCPDGVLWRVERPADGWPLEAQAKVLITTAAQSAANYAAAFLPPEYDDDEAEEVRLTWRRAFSERFPAAVEGQFDRVGLPLRMQRLSADDGGGVAAGRRAAGGSARPPRRPRARA